MSKPKANFIRTFELMKVIYKKWAMNTETKPQWTNPKDVTAWVQL
jgi:hypothetical protein